MKIPILNVILSCWIHVLMAEVSGDAALLLNKCIDSKYHKSVPGPEAELFQQCTPWKNHSCCTHNTTQHAHHGSLYNFNYNHCGPKKNMSQDCRRHFIQDQCFYECSPNVGPWAVKVQMKIRNERFYGVPLCQEDCDAWFNACLDDYTCTDNWGRNFNWSKEGNSCLKGTECRTFREVFETANNFCEKVWDHSWQVVPNNQPCMRLWFDGSLGNPNDNVAALKAEELVNQANSACKMFVPAAYLVILLLSSKLS